MIQNNLNNFLGILNDDATAFCIDAALSMPDVVSRPTGIEIYNIIMQTVNDFLERYLFACFYRLDRTEHDRTHIKSNTLLQFEIICALDEWLLFSRGCKR